MAASDDFKLKLPSNPCMRSARAPVGPTGQQSCCSTNNCSGYRRRSAHEPDTPPRLRKQTDRQQDSPFSNRLTRRPCPIISRTGRFALTSCSASGRSEEHTSELQSRGHLVCRLPLEIKKLLNAIYLG